MSVSTEGWSYGAEHELADWDWNGALPPDFGRDKRDITIVNSNGIANDPTGRLYDRGGEINTPPTFSRGAQGTVLDAFLRRHPDARVNYRSNLHIHVRVPGLSDSLIWLKRVQSYIHETMPVVLPQIEPIPRPTAESFPLPSELEGALRRWRRRRVSHQTLLTPARLRGQLGAVTINDFFRLEVPASRKGTPMWHFQPRLCVNLRQLRETDTVEFRHFPGTLVREDVVNCVDWCHWFMIYALEDRPISRLLSQPAFQTLNFPKFPRYNHRLERRYRATCHDHTLSKAKIKENIELILAGKFEESCDDN